MTVEGHATVALDEYDTGWLDSPDVDGLRMIARRQENQCFMMDINCTGSVDGLVVVGGSVVFDDWGARVPALERAGWRVAAIRASHTRDIRSRYPLLRDRQA